MPLILILQFLLTVHLLSVSDSYGSVVKFDKNGDSVGQYRIYNYLYNSTNKKHYYVNVGEYRDDKLLIKNDQVTWPGRAEQPESICSEECRIGFIKKYKESQCCWDCRRCMSNQYVVNKTECVKCPIDTWPYLNKTGCYKLQYQYMQMSSWFAIVPLFLSVSGSLSTIGIIGVFFFYKDTPIVRASGRELSFLILSGCLLCYIVAFCFQMKPHVVTCTVQRIGFGLGFAIMYSSLLTKTNRIARIFESAQKTAKRPPCISPKSQLMICAALISVQIICNAILLSFSPPGLKLDRKDAKKPVLKCKIETNAFLVPQLYNIFLISVCTFYAIKTRKIPENFNESKFIGFTMYTTCIIWLACIAIYFGTLHSFEVQLSTLGIAISMSAWVTLVCLFSPKLYIIFMQPEKNVRKLTMSSTTYRKPTNSSGSFANHRGENASEYTPLPAPPSSAPAAVGVTAAAASKQHLIVVSVQSHSPSTNEPSSTVSNLSSSCITIPRSAPPCTSASAPHQPQPPPPPISTVSTGTKPYSFPCSHPPNNTGLKVHHLQQPQTLSSIPSPTLINLDDEPPLSPPPSTDDSNACPSYCDYFSSIKDIQEHLDSQVYMNSNNNTNTNPSGQNCAGSPFSQRRVKFPVKKTFFTDFNQQNITSL